MGLEIIKSALSSREVREIIGTRLFKPSALSSQQKSGGLTQAIVGGLLRLGGFLLSSIVGFASWSLSALWGLIVQSISYLWTFDWNVPDKQLDSRVKSQWESYASTLGGTAGNLFGWFACGVLPGVSIFAFNKALGLYVLKNVGEEALEELAANVANAVRQGFRNVAQASFIESFKNFRRWMKEPNNTFAKALFGKDYAKVMKAWGAQGSPSWSFAIQLEKRVESIPNRFLQNFVEEFLEEAWDACVEAGFVVANSVESYLAMQREAKAQVLGPERIIEVLPDRSADEERIILAGPEELVKAQLPQALLHHQLIENRNIGQFVGQSVEDEAREGDLGLRLKILLYNVPAPPWEGARNEKPRRVTVTIPDVKRSRLDWADIRAACGGQNGYLWGRFRASAKLSNGRRLECFGATKQEAEDRCKAFIVLSEAELKTITVTEELKEGDRLVNPGLYKETTRVYPAYCFILNRERVLVGDQGRPVGKYRYRDARFRLELWGSNKPYDWEDIVQDALSKSGSGVLVSP